MNNLERYDAAFATALNIPLEEVSDKLAFNVIPSWDSIGQMVLVSSIEDAFDIVFEPEDIFAFDSYRKGMDILSASYGIAF